MRCIWRCIRWGDIVFNMTGVNPGTTFGGTWVAWGSGRVPVGVDTGQGEFNSVEETGGQKTHTLSSSEMPSHSHSFSGSSVSTGNQSASHTHYVSGTTGSSGAHQHGLEWNGDRPISLSSSNNGGSYSSAGYRTGYSSGSVYTFSMIASTAGAHSHSFSDTSNAQSASHHHSVTAVGSIGSSGNWQCTQQSSAVHHLLYVETNGIGKTKSAQALFYLGGIAMQTLRLKRPYMRGTDVETFQTTIAYKGFDCGVIDGIFGPKSELACREYQRTHGLAVDGICGPITWASLQSSSGGSTDAVALLKEWGFSDLLAAKGITYAVKQFQAAMGLAVDGIVGPNTNASLNGEIFVPRITEETMACQCQVHCDGYPKGHVSMGVRILSERIFREVEKTYPGTRFYNHQPGASDAQRRDCRRVSVRHMEQATTWRFK